MAAVGDWKAALVWIRETKRKEVRWRTKKCGKGGSRRVARGASISGLAGGDRTASPLPYLRHRTKVTASKCQPSAGLPALGPWKGFDLNPCATPSPWRLARALASLTQPSCHSPCVFHP